MKKTILMICFCLLFTATLVTGIVFGRTLIPSDDGESTPPFIFGGTPYGKSIAITLETDGNCTVVSSNPVYVKYGETAKFQVVFNENYQLGSTSALYKNGYICVEDCIKSASHYVTSKKINEYCSFDYELPASAEGNIVCNKTPGVYLSNQTITITAEPKGESKFTGWSVGGTVLDGGRMVSYSTSYSFKLNGDVKLYANFLKDGYSYIKYNLNGGTLSSDGVTDVIIAQINTAAKPCPNLMADTGEISRDGYTLLEFTTSKDGSGTAINPGGLVDIPDSGVLEVWAQWSKWTEASAFSFTQANGEITITKYNENQKTVSVPAYINGLPVTKISKNAFVNKDFDTLVLPKTILSMDSSAFSGCKSFNTLYIFDTFKSIPDDAFSNCKAFSNLRLNAGRNPSYPSNAESVATRLGYIMTRENYSNKPIILLVGGSSSLFGFDSQYLEELLGNQYYVINCGTNAGGCGMLYIEALSSFMRPGDIIMNVPEFGNVQFGDPSLYWRTFRATESCYNIYRYVDFSKYKKFFSAMSEFNSSTEARANLSESSYEIKNTTLTDFNCDLNRNRVYSSRPAYSSISINKGLVTEERIKTFNEVISIVKSKGLKYYIGSAPVYNYKLNATDTSIREFVEAMSAINAPYISDPNDYKYDDNMFYDSQYHLTTEGALLRTKQLSIDLITQFNKEKNSEP